MLPGAPRATHAAQRLQRREALLEIAVQIARLRLAALALVLQHLDFAAHGAQLRLQRVDALRHLEQALVGHHALDALQARIEIVHADLHRIFLRRNRAAPERRDSSSTAAMPGAAMLMSNLALLQVHDLDAAIERIGLLVAARRRRDAPRRS